MARRATRPGTATTGYRGLLNLESQPHWTVFLPDFDLEPQAVDMLRRELRGLPTHVLFIRIDQGLPAVRSAMAEAGIRPAADYISLHGLAFRHRNIQRVISLFNSLPRRDSARLDLPDVHVGFRPEHASYLLRVVANADYGEQQHISHRFYELLRKRVPYRVKVRTPGAELEVADRRGWVDAAGRLFDGENRILPSGEVSYGGERINGSFTVDGAILPSPQHPDFAKQAVTLGRSFKQVPREPFTFEIENARVKRVVGKGDAAAAVARLVERDERYRQVTEVGISFNRASEFVYDWPAASNETRPGVHIAIGGDNNPDEPDSEPLIHLDCMAANAAVEVNAHPFLRASS